MKAEATHPLALPLGWAADSQARARFFKAIGEAEAPMLICDYDGTLAPFQVDKMQAISYPGIVERLASIASGGTTIAFVSGRPAGELIQLLPLAAGMEIWGMHGREHRAADGVSTVLEPTEQQRSVLDQVQAQLVSEGWGSLLERKIGSLAMHWRTLHADAAWEARGNAPAPEAVGKTPDEARAAAENAFNAQIGKNAFAVLPFDGGLELRTEDRTKAHAVEALLAGTDAAAAAFLGDDLTDEDGFRVMHERGGLGLLVRPEARPSYASFSLRPPDELLTFLDDWAGVRL